jgi:hypothetical protein
MFVHGARVTHRPLPQAAFAFACAACRLLGCAIVNFLPHTCMHATTWLVASVSIICSSDKVLMDDAPLPASVQRRAKLFDQPECRAAIAIAAQAPSEWRRLCSSVHRVELCNGNVQQVVHDRNRSMAYVHNQKSGSQAIGASFSAFIAQNQQGSTSQNPFNPSAGRNWLLRPPTLYSTFSRTSAAGIVFSFVRDPSQMALAAYMDILQRASPAWQMQAQSGGYGAAFQEVSANLRELFGRDEVGPDSCEDELHATRQYRRYLEALLNRTLLGYELFHAFPQAHKLDHVQPKEETASAGGLRYDAIGTLESLAHDVEQVGALIQSSRSAQSTTSSQRPWQLGPAASLGKHSTKGLSCANISAHDEHVQRLVCELYRADFVCFGYHRGHCGATSMRAPLDGRI